MSLSQYIRLVEAERNTFYTFFNMKITRIILGVINVMITVNK